jgi:hypothetical protein
LCICSPSWCTSLSQMIAPNRSRYSVLYFMDVAKWFLSKLLSVVLFYKCLLHVAIIDYHSCLSARISPWLSSSASSMSRAL